MKEKCKPCYGTDYYIMIKKISLVGHIFYGTAELLVELSCKLFFNNQFNGH